MRFFSLVVTGLAIVMLAALPAKEARAAVSGDAAAGKALAESSCASCHLVSPDQTSATTEAPPFETIAKRPPEEIENLPAFLAAPHPPMPPISLTRRQIDDIVAYIESLK